MKSKLLVSLICLLTCDQRVVEGHSPQAGEMGSVSCHQDGIPARAHCFAEVIRNLLPYAPPERLFSYSSVLLSP